MLDNNGRVETDPPTSLGWLGFLAHTLQHFVKFQLYIVIFLFLYIVLRLILLDFCIEFLFYLWLVILILDK